MTAPILRILILVIPLLSTRAFAATPFEDLTPQITRLYQRFTACQKGRDDAREIACLRQLERDARELTTSQANQFTVRAAAILSPAQAQPLKSVVPAADEYQSRQCTYAQLKAGPMEDYLGRRTHARCVIRVAAEVAYATLAYESGRLVSVAAADYQDLPREKAAEMKALFDHAAACSGAPAAPERDACAARTLAAIDSNATRTFADAGRAASVKSKPKELRASFDAGQAAWSIFRDVLCRATADLRPAAAGPAYFNDACRARVTLARLRELSRER